MVRRWLQGADAAGGDVYVHRASAAVTAVMDMMTKVLSYARRRARALGARGNSHCLRAVGEGVRTVGQPVLRR